MASLAARAVKAIGSVFNDKPADQAALTRQRERINGELPHFQQLLADAEKDAAQAEDLAIAAGQPLPDAGAVDRLRREVASRQRAIQRLDQDIAAAESAARSAEADAARADLQAAVQERCDALAVLYALGAETNRLSRALDSAVHATNLPENCRVRVDAMPRGAGLRTGPAVARLAATGNQAEAAALAAEVSVDNGAVEAHAHAIESALAKLLGPTIPSLIQSHAARIVAGERDAAAAREAEQSQRTKVDAAVQSWMRGMRSITNDAEWVLACTANHRCAERGAVNEIPAAFTAAMTSYQLAARAAGKPLRAQVNAPALARALGLDRL